MRVSWLGLVGLLTICLTASAQLGLGNLFRGSGEPPDPKHGKITFWDPQEERQRGIRALLYFVLPEPENWLVDQRLYDQMAAYLGYFCQDVFTLNSFEDPTRRQMVENVLVQLVDQWQEQGVIRPATLFNGIPFLNVDVVVLMERTHYDQVWKGDEKRLLIGINTGAFELDFGSPLYNDRYLKDVNWFGERANYSKAEKEALVEIADMIGDRFQQAAMQINQARETELRAMIETRKREQELLEEQTNQEKQFYSSVLQQADAFLKEHTDPPEFINNLRTQTNMLRDRLTGYGVETIIKEDGKLKRKRNQAGPLTPQDEAELQELAASIQEQMQAYDSVMQQRQQALQQAQQQRAATQQAQQQKQPVLLFSPTPTGTSAPVRVPVALPVLEIPRGGIFDRAWLIPTPTPTPEVSTEGLPERSGDVFEGLPRSDSASLLTQPQPIVPNASRRIPTPPPLPNSIIRRFSDPNAATAALQNASGPAQNDTAAN